MNDVACVVFLTAAQGGTKRADAPLLDNVLSGFKMHRRQRNGRLCVPEWVTDWIVLVDAAQVEDEPRDEDGGESSNNAK